MFGSSFFTDICFRLKFHIILICCLSCIKYEYFGQVKDFEIITTDMLSNDHLIIYLDSGDKLVISYYKTPIKTNYHVWYSGFWFINPNLTACCVFSLDVNNSKLSILLFNLFPSLWLIVIPSGIGP